MSTRRTLTTAFSRVRRIAAAGAAAGAAGLLAPGAVAAQDFAGEVGFILNTFSALVWAVLVMWMCAGFTMLEAGSVRSKNASMICMKNIGLYSIAGLAYWIIGYSVMYVDVGSLVGSFSSGLFYGPSAEEVALLGDSGSAAAVVEQDSSSKMSQWFFQMVFVATTASIISGALAERIKLWAFFGFTAVLTGLIYPIVGAWTWGEGWLYELGFTDFAGSTIVHSTGGWAALAGALVLGPRWGKFRKDGSVKITAPSNIPAVTLGVFILWMGWFAFNGGSQLAMSGVADAVAISNIMVNTNIAAGAGVVTALIFSRPILGRLDLFGTLNGAIAGLVSITAAPDITSPAWALLIGAVGAIVCLAGLRFLEAKKIDDVVGAVPAHLFAGVWGTLAACFSSGATLWVQLVGIGAIGIFVFFVSLGLWLLLSKIMGGIRISRTVEELGQDAAELGIDAYPEFALMVDPDQDDYRDPD